MLEYTHKSSRFARIGIYSNASKRRRNLATIREMSFRPKQGVAERERKKSLQNRNHRQIACVAITRCKPRARKHKTRNFIHVPIGESLAESFSSALDVHPIGCLRLRLAGLFKVLFPLTIFFRALVLSDKINCAIFLSSRAAPLAFCEKCQTTNWREARRKTFEFWVRKSLAFLWLFIAKFASREKNYEKIVEKYSAVVLLHKKRFRSTMVYAVNLKTVFEAFSEYLNERQWSNLSFAFPAFLRLTTPSVVVSFVGVDIDTHSLQSANTLATFYSRYQLGRLTWRRLSSDFMFAQVSHVRN